MSDTKVVTNAMLCVVINKVGKILRAPDKKYSPGKWAPVGAAPLTEYEDMEKIAKRELVDELGVKGKILSHLKPKTYKIDNENWVVHPFLAQVGSEKVKLNEEHTQFKWIALEEIDNYYTVPGLKSLTKELLQKTSR